MKKYEVGVDITFGAFVLIEASDAEEAEKLAEQLAVKNTEYPKIGDTAAHYVAVKAHSVYE